MKEEQDTEKQPVFVVTDEVAKFIAKIIESQRESMSEYALETVSFEPQWQDEFGYCTDTTCTYDDDSYMWYDYDDKMLTFAFSCEVTLEDEDGDITVEYLDIYDIAAQNEECDDCKIEYATSKPLEDFVKL